MYYVKKKENNSMKALHAIAMAVMDFIYGLAFIYGLFALLNWKSGNEIYVLEALFGVMVVFVLWFALIFRYNKNIKTSKYTALDAAWINLAVRLVLIPIYIIVFILCLIGGMLGPFAIGIWGFALIVDSFMLLMTNLMSIPCFRAMRRSGVFGILVTILLFLCQFIFCLDVIVAIVLYEITKSRIANKIEGVDK
jgi:hypothetical protein